MDDLIAASAVTDSKEVSDDKPKDSTKLTPAQERAIVKEATERRQYIRTVDKENRDAAREDTKFCWERGAQWPQAIKNARGMDPGGERPCLEMNQLPQFVRQVVNDQRQVRPSIKILPADGGDENINKKRAQLRQGLIRGIEYRSNANAVYDSAMEHAVTSGRGYLRVLTDWESPDSFHQEIKLQRIPDPLAVELDPDYIDPDAGDINYGFVLEKMSKEEYARRWPDAPVRDWDAIASEWKVSDEQVVVCDYLRKVYSKDTLYLLSDGTTAWRSDLPEGKSPPKEMIVKERASERVKVEWFKLGGEQVLEVVDWPGQYIPIAMDIGEEITVDGKRIHQGLIRRARDPQTMFNVHVTTATERVLMAPKAPWVMAEGQDSGFEDMWQSSNRVNYSRLIYKPRVIDGQLAPPPQRNAPPDVGAGLMQLIELSRNDLKSTIGMYDPSLGNRSQEVSGRAILARERQGDTGQYHFVDNHARFIAHVGRIIDDLIPHIYDAQRMVELVGDEDERKTQQVNSELPHPTEQGKMVRDPATDLTAGKFSVIVDVGPNYLTKRQEASESMMEFLKVYPAAAQITGDLVARNQDWPGADKFAQRLRAAVPPNILAAEAQDDQSDPEVVQMQQQMKQMQQQAQQAIGQLQGELQKVAQERDSLKNKSEAQLADSQTKSKAEDRANRELIVNTALELIKLQQTQSQPVTNEFGEVVQAAAPVVDMAPMLALIHHTLTTGSSQEMNKVAQVLQQHGQVLQGVAQKVGALQDYMTAPREIVRHPDGRPAAVRVHTSQGPVDKPVATDHAGRPVAVQ